MNLQQGITESRYNNDQCKQNNQKHKGGGEKEQAHSTFSFFLPLLNFMQNADEDKQGTSKDERKKEKL